MTEEGRTLIVSNRLPVSSTVTGGRIELKPSSGGLVTGLAGVHGDNSLWVGALGVATTSTMKLSEDDQAFLKEHGLSPVDIPQDLYDDYYEGFSNSAVWPLFHYMSERCRFSSTSWQSFRTRLTGWISRPAAATRMIAPANAPSRTPRSVRRAACRAVRYSSILVGVARDI